MATTKSIADALAYEIRNSRSWVFNYSSTTLPSDRAVQVNLDNGQQRTIKADKSGSFSFSKLAPGRYKVSSEGVTREAMVSIGTGTTVALDTEELDRIEIRGTRSRVIDVTSTESNSVFTAEQIRSLPVARDI